MSDKAYEPYWERWLSVPGRGGAEDDFYAKTAFRAGFLAGLRHKEEVLPEISRTGELSEIEWDLCKQGKIIAAIREVRERTGLDLKSAKAFVDKHRPPKEPR